MAGVVEGNEAAPSTTYGPVDTIVGPEASSSGLAHGQMRMGAMHDIDSEELLMAFSALQGNKPPSSRINGFSNC